MIVRYKPKKESAINLRRRGYSYREILDKVHVAKSTLSEWINQEMTESEERNTKELTAIRGLRKLIKINKKRSNLIKKAEEDIQNSYAAEIREIDNKSLFWLGLGLYLAEGAKTGRWKPVFYNSNPVLNKIMYQYFLSICNAPHDKMHVQLVLHKHISETKARKYWSKKLHIPESKFYKASYIESKASKGKRPKNRLPYGTVQLSVGNKAVFNKIKGWSLGISRIFS